MLGLVHRFRSGMSNPGAGSLLANVSYPALAAYLKKYKKLLVNDGDLVKEFKLHRTVNMMSYVMSYVLRNAATSPPLLLFAG